MRGEVIGQTGRVVLSDSAINRKLSRKRTVRYQYSKLGRKRWAAWVCGPFHSRTYGAHGFGATKMQSKVALQRHLANSYGYFGHLMFSDVDESDTVGEVDVRLLDNGATARPIHAAV